MICSTPSTHYCLSSFLLYNIPPKIIYGSCVEYISALSKLQGQKEGVFSTVEAQLKWTKQAQGWDREKNSHQGSPAHVGLWDENTTNYDTFSLLRPSSCCNMLATSPHWSKTPAQTYYNLSWALLPLLQNMQGWMRALPALELKTRHIPLRYFRSTLEGYRASNSTPKLVSSIYQTLIFHHTQENHHLNFCPWKRTSVRHVWHFTGFSSSHLSIPFYLSLFHLSIEFNSMLWHLTNGKKQSQPAFLFLWRCFSAEAGPDYLTGFQSPLPANAFVLPLLPQGLGMGFSTTLSSCPHTSSASSPLPLWAQPRTYTRSSTAKHFFKASITYLMNRHFWIQEQNITRELEEQSKTEPKEHNFWMHPGWCVLTLIQTMQKWIQR